MQENYTEKEILGDALASEKAATENYNRLANECAHQGLRDAILDCLDKEHEIQVDVFNKMHDMGYYPTPAAQDDKVAQLKQKFSQTATLL